MASAAVQAIIDDGQCAVCTGGTLYQTMEIGLLMQILSGLGVTMTQAEIMSEASCFTCLGMSLPQAVALVLLNAISVEITGGVGGGAVAVSGDPNGVTTADNLQFGWDSVNDVLWIHEGADGTNTGWIQIV